jgi:hypothetical protein
LTPDESTDITTVNPIIQPNTDHIQPDLTSHQCVVPHRRASNPFTLPHIPSPSQDQYHLSPLPKIYCEEKGIDLLSGNIPGGNNNNNNMEFLMRESNNLDSFGMNNFGQNNVQNNISQHNFYNQNSFGNDFPSTVLNPQFIQPQQEQHTSSVTLYQLDSDRVGFIVKVKRPTVELKLPLSKYRLVLKLQQNQQTQTSSSLIQINKKNYNLIKFQLEKYLPHFLNQNVNNNNNNNNNNFDHDSTQGYKHTLFSPADEDNENKLDMVAKFDNSDLIKNLKLRDIPTNNNNEDQKDDIVESRYYTPNGIANGNNGINLNQNNQQNNTNQPRNNPQNRLPPQPNPINTQTNTTNTNPTSNIYNPNPSTHSSPPQLNNKHLPSHPNSNITFSTPPTIPPIHSDQQEHTCISDVYMDVFPKSKILSKTRLILTDFILIADTECYCPEFIIALNQKLAEYRTELERERR